MWTGGAFPFAATLLLACGDGPPLTDHDAGTSPDVKAGSCGAFPKDYTSGNGSVTYYTFSGGAAVNCSFDVVGVGPDKVAMVTTGQGQYFGAMNTADYANAAVCGACVEVTRDGKKTVDITIVDQCPTATNPKCTAGHIDLSQAAFEQIGAATEGYLGTGNGAAVGVISWKYIPCPVGTSDVSFRLKDGSNPYWNQILVETHRYPIANVEAFVNGAWVSGTRQSYNYWQVGNGNMGPAPYKVRARDINGTQVEATLSLGATDQPTTSQFPMCQ